MHNPGKVQESEFLSEPSRTYWQNLLIEQFRIFQAQQEEFGIFGDLFPVRRLHLVCYQLSPVPWHQWHPLIPRLCKSILKVRVCNSTLEMAQNHRQVETFWKHWPFWLNLDEA